jgi:hypothetical protein
MYLILEQLKSDPELERYYKMKAEENAKYLDAIVQVFIQDEAALKGYCIATKPSSPCGLEIVYEALSYCKTEVQGKEQFLASEFIRVFNASLSADYVEESTACLNEIYIDYEKYKSHHNKVISFLTNFLDHEKLSIKYKAMQFICYWIEDEYKNKYFNTIEKIKSDLSHEDWKIRWLTYHKLKDYELMDRAELKLSLIDRLRGMMKNPENLIYQ